MPGGRTDTETRGPPRTQSIRRRLRATREEQAGRQKASQGDLNGNRCRQSKLRRAQARRNGSETAKVVGESCPRFGPARSRVPKRAHRCFVGDTRLHSPGRTPYSGRDRRSCARPGSGCVLLEDGRCADGDSLSSFRGHAVVTPRLEFGPGSHGADHPRGLHPQERPARLRSNHDIHDSRADHCFQSSCGAAVSEPHGR